MTTTIWGLVKEGRIVPGSPLPEGAHVEIRLADPSIEVPEELRAEFEAWDRAAADALELVERLAQEGEADQRSPFQDGEFAVELDRTTLA
jgi:hypothetical protein